MKIILLIITIFFLHTPSYGQFDTSFYHRDKWEKEQNFDSLIRVELNGKLSNSYYVITYPLLAGTTSWVPQFIKIYNKIKNTKKDIVLVFYLDGSLRKKDIPLFMHDLFKLSEEEIKQIKIIYNDNLYETLTENRHLVRLQYYFRRNLYYNEAGKWHKVTVESLPVEKINIKQTNKIKLIGIDSLLIFERDAVFPYTKDHLLLLTDSRNIIYDINTLTGQVLPILNLPAKYNAAEIYCEFFAKFDSTKCSIARNGETVFTDVNRKVFSVASVHFINNKLILPTGIEAVEADEKDFNYTNDEGVKKSIKAGTTSLRSNQIIIQYDLFTKQILINPIINHNSKERDTYILPHHGFYFKGDTIITSTTNWYYDDRITYGLIKLVPANGYYMPDRDILPHEKESGLLRAGYGTKCFFYNFNENWYFTHDFLGDISLVGRDPIQGCFYGNGSQPFAEEKYSKFLDDTTDWEINFLYQDIKPIFNNKYLLSIGTFKDKPILEVKNRMFKTVDIIEVKDIEGLSPYFKCQFRDDILIHENKIYYKCIENGEMYLKIFSISQE